MTIEIVVREPRVVEVSNRIVEAEVVNREAGVVEIGVVESHVYNYNTNEIPISSLLAAEGNIDLNGYNIINVGEPVRGSDAVTKEYVDESIVSNVSNVLLDGGNY
jgi:hypothetical protein